MAAGLGFKTFTTGEVLTAADTNGYLMQGVLVFASAAARDAAITSPQEGQFAYLKDTNVTTYYTGSAWTNLDTTGMVNPMTTTGDTIYSSSGSTPARLGIGSTGQVLTVAGGIPSWATPASGSTFVGAVAAMSADFNVSTATFTAIPFAATDYLDTDAFHSTTTNNTRMTIPAGKAGKYWVYAGGFFQSGGSTNSAVITIYLNGVTTNGVYTNFIQDASHNAGMRTGAILTLAVGDYVECVVYQASGGTRVWNDKGTLGLYYLGA